MKTHTRRARWKKTERKKCVIKATATGFKVAAGGLHKSTAKGSRLRWWRSFAVGKSASSCVPDTGDATVTPSFAELEKLRDSPWGKCTRLSFFVMTGEAEKKSHWTYLVASWKYPRNGIDQLTRQGKGILHCKVSVICPFCKLGSISHAIFFSKDYLSPSFWINLLVSGVSKPGRHHLCLTWSTGWIEKRRHHKNQL